MIEPVNRILMDCPVIFFKRVLEYTDSAFFEAFTLADRIEEPEKANILGQIRHARCEAALRRAAKESGLSVFARHTTPAGSCYSLVEVNGIYLIRSNIQRHCGVPRPTVFRRQWSALNQWLEPLQLDLLDAKYPPPDDRLCGMIVTTVHPHLGKPNLPNFVGLGLPWPDLSGWAMLMPLTDLLARYYDEETKRQTPLSAPVDVIDRAVPKLKKRPNS